MQGCACVNGQFVAPSRAKISVFDRGFLHSDVAYDVAHVSATSTWCVNWGILEPRTGRAREERVAAGPCRPALPGRGARLLICGSRKRHIGGKLTQIKSHALPCA